MAFRCTHEWRLGRNWARLKTGQMMRKMSVGVRLPTVVTWHERCRPMTYHCSLLLLPLLLIGGASRVRHATLDDCIASMSKTEHIFQSTGVAKTSPLISDLLCFVRNRSSGDELQRCYVRPFCHQQNKRTWNIERVFGECCSVLCRSEQQCSRGLGNRSYVCSSVRLSVTCVLCDKTKQPILPIF